MDEMTQVYQQHAQTIYHFLLSQCRREDLAEELTQETFCQAVSSISRFDGSCKISTWLCQIARHLWYQYLEKHKAERAALQSLPDPLAEEQSLPRAPSAEEEAAAQQDRLRLLRQIHALREPTREVVYLGAFGGLSFREIGDVLGRTEAWARVTFYRGKETLRKDGGTDAY